MTRRQQLLITVLSTAVAALLLLLSRRVWTRFDLTANKAYTLSPASRNLHNEIEDEVRITYYRSNKLVSLDPTPGEITDLLREYSGRSRGKIRVTVQDPSGTEIAERYNLGAQQIQNVDQTEASFTLVYSGVVIEYLNRAEVIPWVFSLDTLEYDVTSRIRTLVSGKKRELGVITADPGKSWNKYYGFLNQVFSQSGFGVTVLGAGEEIPETLPVLIVLGGVESLDRYSLYRIDRYIQMGGRALFAVESVNVDTLSSWEARLMIDQGLLAMISYYGATVGQSIVMDAASLPIPYQDPMTRQVRLVRYAPWIEVLGQNGSRTAALTANTAGIDLFWASPLSLILPDTGKVTGQVLFSSTPEAWLMTQNFDIRLESSYGFTAEQETTTGSKILVAALEGEFPSWFEGEDKPRRESQFGELRDMPQAARETRIVVIGDSDLAGSIIQYTQSERNLDFFIKAVDWLGNDDDIVGIRNRRSGEGRLDRITDPLERTGFVQRARVINVILIPLGILVFALVRGFKRKSAVTRDAVKKELGDAR